MREGVREIGTFELYLRTGLRLPEGRVEVKFNPWHDPANGQFTFRNGGRYFAAGTRAAIGEDDSAGQDRRTFGDGGATGSYGDDPDDARNYTIYTVRPGDTLSRIAGFRRGVTAADLAALNNLPADARLQIGQRLKVLNQSYLDAARDAKNRFLALDYYMRTHGGKLPPNAAHPPSLVDQMLSSDWRRVTKNGYDFRIDPFGRTQQVYGLLHFAVAPRRSRTSQRRAGGVDRRAATDDGGHYVAARFDGPSDSFNHFAQDANFNRGAYRALEDQWAGALRGGKKVFVDIRPHYTGTSQRPDRIDVVWYIDGRRKKGSFPNENSQEKVHGR